MTDADVEHIGWLDDRIASAQTPLQWVQYDEDFHLATYTPAKRARTLELVTVLRRSLNAYYLRYLGPKTRDSDWRTEHQAIRSALHARDSRAATKALEHHLFVTRDALLVAVKSEEAKRASKTETTGNADE